MYFCVHETDTNIQCYRRKRTKMSTFYMIFSFVLCYFEDNAPSASVSNCACLRSSTHIKECLFQMTTFIEGFNAKCDLNQISQTSLNQKEWLCHTVLLNYFTVSTLSLMYPSRTCSIHKYSLTLETICGFGIYQK